MAKSELEIIIGIKDTASGPLAKLRGALGGIATIAGGILGAQVLSRLATGLYNLGAGAIAAASNLNEAVNATSVVFGEAAQKVQDFGAQAAETTGLSAAAFNQMGAQVGAMLINYGLTADDAADQTINLAQRAADMASIFNTDVSVAMEAISAGLRGEIDPLEKFGVSLTAAAVKAKAMELGLVDANGEISVANMTQARLALLLEQTNDIAGDFVNTSDDLANATRINQARWENFRAEIGTNFLPIMQTFQGMLMEVGNVVFPIISKAMADIAPKLQALAEGIASVITALFDAGPNSIEFKEALEGLVGSEVAAFFLNLIARLQEFGAWVNTTGLPAIKAFLSAIWVQLGPGLAQLGTWISSLAEILLPLLGKAIQFVIDNWNLFGPVLGVIAGIILAIVSPIAAVIAGIILLATAWANNWGGIQEKFAAVWDFLEPKLIALRDWLSVNLPLAIETLKTYWTGTLLPALRRVGDWITTNLKPKLDALDAFMLNVMTTTAHTLADAWTKTLLPALTKVGGWITTNLKPKLDDLDAFMLNKLTETTKGLAGAWENTLKPALGIVFEFIRDSLTPALSALWDLMKVEGGIAITLLKGFWDDVLLPALTRVRDFLSLNLTPEFTKLGDYIQDILGPIIAAFSGERFLSNLQFALDLVAEKLALVTDWLIKVKEQLLGISSVPISVDPSIKNLSKGAENATKGVKAMSETPLAQLAAGLGMAGLTGALTPSMAGAQAGAGFNQNVTQNFYDQGAAAIGMAIVTSQSRGRLRGRLGLR